MKRLAVLFCVPAVLVSLPLYAGALPQDTAVRVEGSGIEPGWFEGKVAIVEGCTMVKLAKPTKDKYTMLALVAVAKLQKKEASGWRDMALDELKSHEPKRCLQEGAD